MLGQTETKPSWSSGTKVLPFRWCPSLPAMPTLQRCHNTSYTLIPSPGPQPHSLPPRTFACARQAQGLGEQHVLITGAWEDCLPPVLHETGDCELSRQWRWLQQRPARVSREPCGEEGADAQQLCPVNVFGIQTEATGLPLMPRVPRSLMSSLQLRPCTSCSLHLALSTR